MDRPRRRKLLAASVGIAAVSYVVGIACNDGVTSGNLPAPAPRDAADEQQNVISGNLPAPPPPDASQDGGDAGDGGDASDAASGDASDASSD